MEKLRRNYGYFTQDLIWMKRASLIILSVQSAFNVIISHYVRSRPGDMFISSTAVAMSELVKFLICIVTIFLENKMRFRLFAADLHANLFVDCRDNLLICVPGVVYAILNNLLFLAVTQLSASVFQITYQLKILTTAIFFRIILHRIVSLKHYIALVLLFVGVAITQLDSVKSDESASRNTLLGLLYVLVACMLSGFASVFFEMILKSTNKTVVMRNIQLSVYGFLASLLSVFIQDWSLVSSKGFFHGYDRYVWLVILIQSVGGLICAAVVRYADNILKNFSTTVAIVLTLFISNFITDSRPSSYIVVGTALVILSTVFYGSLPPPAMKASQPKPDMSHQFIPPSQAVSLLLKY